MHWLVITKVKAVALAEGQALGVSVGMWLVLVATRIWTAWSTLAKPHTSLKTWTMMRKERTIGVTVYQPYVGTMLPRIRITGNRKKVNPRTNRGKRAHTRLLL